MILKGEGWIYYERGTPVGSKEVWGKLLHFIDLQGGEILLWFRTEALFELLKEMEREILATPGLRESVRLTPKAHDTACKRLFLANFS